MNKNISQQQSVMMEMNKETDMISSLIHEYLYKKDYNKTLDVFQIELTDKIKNNIYYKPQFKDINDTNLLRVFFNVKIHDIKIIISFNFIDESFDFISLTISSIGIS